MKYSKIASILLLSIVIKISFINVGMFWDNVLFASKMGLNLLDNGIFNWLSIPNESDPGHPPFLATLLAISWSIFGKSLTTSHMTMIPFVFGTLFQIYLFVSHFIKNKNSQLLGFLFVIADPTFLSQLILVNPEIIQLFFFFLALNGLLKSNKILKLTGLSFLGLASYRGMMLCGGIFLVDIILSLFVYKKKIYQFFNRKTILTYLLGALPAFLYITFRLVFKGWISDNPEEVWGNAWQFDSSEHFFVNLFSNSLVLGHRFLDFGRYALFGFVIVTYLFKRKQLNWNQLRPIFIIFIFSTFIIYFISLLMKNPMGHRYFIPSYLSFSLLTFIILNQFKRKHFIYFILFGSLLLGNFIIYPKKISQGWDASLAHLPYWKLRKKAIDFLDKDGITINETATFFPNRTKIDNIDLNNDYRSFIGFSGKEEYVFYSNVFNLSDEDLLAIETNYLLIKRFEKNRVFVEIYHKKQTTSP